MEEQSSCFSPDSIIYISSSSDGEQSAGWDSDWSTETEDINKKNEPHARWRQDYDNEAV